MVDAKRLAATFRELVAVDSVSRSERRFADLLRRRLEKLGAATSIDGAGAAVGGDCGNLEGALSPSLKRGASKVPAKRYWEPMTRAPSPFCWKSSQSSERGTWTMEAWSWCSPFAKRSACWEAGISTPGGSKPGSGMPWTPPTRTG